MIKKSNKLISSAFIFSIFLLLSVFLKSFAICFHESPCVICGIFAIIYFIIIWSILLALENEIYKIRENINLNDLVKKFEPLLSIVFSSIYIIFILIIPIIFLFRECSKNFIKKIVIFILEFLFNILIFVFIPGNKFFKKKYFQDTLKNYNLKYRFQSNYTQAQEENIKFDKLENLNSLNKAFLSFIIITFFFLL